MSFRFTHERVYHGLGEVKITRVQGIFLPTPRANPGITHCVQSTLDARVLVTVLALARRCKGRRLDTPLKPLPSKPREGVSGTHCLHEGVVQFPSSVLITSS